MDARLAFLTLLSLLLWSAGSPASAFPPIQVDDDIGPALIVVAHIEGDPTRFAAAAPSAEEAYIVLAVDRVLKGVLPDNSHRLVVKVRRVILPQRRRGGGLTKESGFLQLTLFQDPWNPARHGDRLEWIEPYRGDLTTQNIWKLLPERGSTTYSVASQRQIRPLTDEETVRKEIDLYLKMAPPYMKVVLPEQDFKLRIPDPAKIEG